MTIWEPFQSDSGRCVYDLLANVALTFVLLVQRSGDRHNVPEQCKHPEYFSTHGIVGEMTHSKIRTSMPIRGIRKEGGRPRPRQLVSLPIISGWSLRMTVSKKMSKGGISPEQTLNFKSSIKKGG